MRLGVVVAEIFAIVERPRFRGLKMEAVVAHGHIGPMFMPQREKVLPVPGDQRGFGIPIAAFDLQFVSSGGTTFDRAAIARMLATGTGQTSIAFQLCWRCPAR